MDYFFISDLHIGGDGVLDECDYETELIDFLAQLAKHPKDAELIIVGDAFGLWEFTEKKGLEKLQTIVDSHQRLFAQFFKTSQQVKITLIPGNHDYELACYPEYIPFLKKYGINLEPKAHIKRQIKGKTIWIEHGNQHDDFNHFAHYGNPASTPIGYYITSQFVGGAGRLSSHGKDSWLKDIQAVYPTEHIPHWVFSNYFYREMSPFLRYFILPFLLLFTVSFFVVILALIEDKGILPTEIAQLAVLQKIGGIGKLLEIIITINSAIILFLLAMAIPCFFLFRDLKSTLTRYRLIGVEHVADVKEKNYNNAAKKIFNQDENVAIFIYGHTHEASLSLENGRAIINTGTWIKMLTRVNSRARFLPDIYVPSYCLSVFHIHDQDDEIAISYKKIPKAPQQELSLLQRILSYKKVALKQEIIPEKTLLK
jgi:UDP-2,3-diacylglucosamine pyrophosphatase LpxH